MISFPQDDSAYFAHPAMSNSRMTEFKRQLEGNFRLPPITDRASDLGHLFHARLFEPHRYAEVLAECKGIISQKDEWLVQRMAEKGKTHLTYQYMMGNAFTVFEKAVLFTHHSIPFKIKPDARLFGLILDGKSTQTGSYDDFVATFEKYGYWRQAYNYMSGAGADNFIFLGVSKQKTHHVFSVDCHDYQTEIRLAKEEMEWLCAEYLKAEEKARKDEEMRLKLIAILLDVKE